MCVSVSDRLRLRGFTLIELAIVLVVIGLIVGGILTGRELMRSAGLRQDISRLSELNSAVNTFRVKYSCLPGDCIDASRFITGMTNGNGDGYISTDGTSVLGTQIMYYNSESAFAWASLARANLIKLSNFDGSFPLNGSYYEPGVDIVNLPSHPDFGMIAGIGRDNGSDLNPIGNVYLLGVKDTMTGEGAVQTMNPPYTTADAYYIDQKADDGRSLAGAMVSVVTSAWDDTNFYPSTPAASGACVSTAAGNPYNLSETVPRCALMVKPGF